LPEGSVEGMRQFADDLAGGRGGNDQVVAEA
jgi:hypothetical protein